MRLPTDCLIFLLVLFVLAGCATTGTVSDTALEETPDFGNQIMVTLKRGTSLPAEVRSFAGGTDTQIGLPGRREVVAASVLSRDLARRHGLRLLDSWSIDALDVDVIVFEVRGGDRGLVMQRIANDPRVESVQSVGSYRTLAYNDPYLYLQDAVRDDHIEQIHASSTGKGVVVGIVDTGMDIGHPELKDRVVYWGNFVAHDQQRFIHDQHGTAVAGVIAAKANNDLGIVGVAPDVDLMVFKACWHEDVTQTRCDSFSLVKALVKALELKPDVLNLSLAGPSDPLVARLIAKAIRQGTVVVSAIDPGLGPAGSFPANMREVIAVTAEPLAADASAVPFTSGVVAPGTDILTTAPDAGYSFESGSSMSTAHVSGIVALLREKDPALSARGAKDLLSHTGRRWGRLPRVDVCAALMKISTETVCTSNALVDARHVTDTAVQVNSNPDSER